MSVFNFIHLLSVMLPIFIPFIPISNKLLYLLLGFYIAVPVHWPFFGNKCVFTLLTIDSNTVESESVFSEIYMKWLYKPLLNVFGYEWKPDTIDLAVNVHAVINILILYILVFLKIM